LLPNLSRALRNEVVHFNPCSNFEQELAAKRERDFASKVRGCTWIQVSTTCGSGWVDVEHAILLWILNSDG
jgi:hypothetical protein